MFSVLNSAVPRLSQSSRDCVPGLVPSQTTTCLTEGHSASGTLGIRSATVNTILAPESSRMYLVSSDLKIELIDTAMPPTFSTAR